MRALGRLGWSLRRIQSETGVHRETVRNYLQAAGIRIRGERRRRLDAAAADANPSSQVTTDPGAPNPASQVFPDSGAPVAEVLASAAKSSCEPYRDAIAGALDRGRNAKAIWQDLVDDHASRRATNRSSGSSGRCSHRRWWRTRESRRRLVKKGRSTTGRGRW